MTDDPSKKTAIANLSRRKIEIEEPIEVPERRRPRIRAVELKPHETDEILALRDAPPPPVGYRYTMDGRLVPEKETELSIADPEAQEIFCEIVEVTGSLRAACDALGIKSMAKAKRYIDRNPDFFEEVEAAADRHRQGLYAHAVQRATVGHMKPIIGGKDKDQIVGYERVVSDSLLTLLLKRHFVEFRDLNKKPDVNVTVNNIPAKKMTREERAKIREVLTQEPPTADPQGIIDIDPESN